MNPVPPEDKVVLEDKIELELRDRLTVVEKWASTVDEWCCQQEQTLQLLAAGLLALAAAGALLAYVQWKARS